ncbi:MAG: hypothetical protein QM496_14310 [Verrucomicrobiota bacterium]
MSEESFMKTQREMIEELIWSGFPQGYVALRNPEYLAGVIDEFIDKDNRDPVDMLQDSVSLNHVAYRMAKPDERLEDDKVQMYRDLAEYVCRGLALAGSVEG